MDWMKYVWDLVKAAWVVIKEFVEGWLGSKP
jgi:hypothetical protein